MKTVAAVMLIALLNAVLPARALACDYKGLSRDRWQCASQASSKDEVADFCTAALVTIDRCADERTGASHLHFLRMKAEVFEDSVDGFMRFGDVRDARSSLSSAIDLYSQLAAASVLTRAERLSARTHIASDRRRLAAL